MAEKHVVLTDDTHQKLRLYCVSRNLKIAQTADEAIATYLGLIANGQNKNGKKAVKK